MTAARRLFIAVFPLLICSPALAGNQYAPAPGGAPAPGPSCADSPIGRLNAQRTDGVDLPVGTLIPVRVDTPLSSKSAIAGEPYSVRLAHDLVIGGRRIASEGDDVIGHVTYSMQARRKLVAKVSKHRWFRSSGCIGLQFDEIVTADGREIAINAVPCNKSPVVTFGKCAGPLCANNKGQIRPTVMTTIKQETKPLLVSAVTVPTELLVSPYAAPVAGALVGFAMPSLLLSPSEEPPSHARLKGAALGAVTGVPGGFIVTQALTRGEEVILHPLDQLILQVQGNPGGSTGGDTSTAASASPPGQPANPGGPSKT